MECQGAVWPISAGTQNGFRCVESKQKKLPELEIRIQILPFFLSSSLPPKKASTNVQKAKQKNKEKPEEESRGKVGKWDFCA